VSQQFTSARHQAALATPTGYRRFSRFTFTRGGDSITLEPVSGSITQDTRRNGKWDGRLSFAGDDLLPTRPGDILTPFGTRVTAELGIELLDGSVSTVPYGTFEITAASTKTQADARTVDVTMGDVSGVVERYRFETSLTIATGTDLGTMINSVISNRTGINPNVAAVGSSLGAARTFGLDTATAPWSELLDVLNGFSRTAWYNRVGHIEVGSINVDPQAAYPLSSLASLSADFDTKPPNVVVARGEAQDGVTTPVQAVAMDTDPSSPTYAGTGPGTSPYGRVTYFFSSPLLLTLPQAQSAAATILSENVGAGATYTLTVPFDPTIGAGDVISVRGSILAVDAVTLDLVGDTTLQVRELS
jgi:hypothetical protein